MNHWSFLNYIMIKTLIKYVESKKKTKTPTFDVFIFKTEVIH